MVLLSARPCFFFSGELIFSCSAMALSNLLYSPQTFSPNPSPHAASQHITLQNDLISQFTTERKENRDGNSLIFLLANHNACCNTPPVKIGDQSFYLHLGTSPPLWILTYLIPSSAQLDCLLTFKHQVSPFEN